MYEYIYIYIYIYIYVRMRIRVHRERERFTMRASEVALTHMIHTHCACVGAVLHQLIWVLIYLYVCPACVLVLCMFLMCADTFVNMCSAFSFESHAYSKTFDVFSIRSSNVF